MDIAEHVTALRTEGARLAEAAGWAGLDEPVPTCPGWQVRDLLAHAGGVHRWAAAHVRGGRPEPLTAEETAALFAAPEEQTLDRYRESHRELVAALSEAKPDTVCWAFLPAPSPVAFWARRQAHETAIHRVDAESASGNVVTGFPVPFAVDGIDELLFGFFSRPGGRLVADPPRSMALQATDAGTAWTVYLDPDGRRFVRGAEPADLTIAGPAGDLYLLLWNRRGPAGLAVDGDPGVLDLWRSRATVRWR